MDKLQYSNLLHIKEASQQGRLVVFVGAGVSNNSGVPTWAELINGMKDECLAGGETDDLKIAQLYKDTRGEKEYTDKVKDVLKHNKVIPNAIHKSILDLNPCHVITTNYDDLLEQEIKKEFKQFDIIREDKDLPNMTYPNSLIKMHGDLDRGNIVLTENDYYNYEKNFPLIRSFVLSLFASKLVLFVGFSFSDLNLKMILNNLHFVLHDNMQRVYLVSDTIPTQTLNTYYEKKGINVVYLCDNDITEILSIDANKVNSGLTNPKGIYLHRILQCILAVRNQLYQIKDQLKSVGNGIRYFIPKEELNEFYRYSDGIDFGSPYFKGLARQLKTFSGRKKFLSEHKDINRRELKEIACNNCLYKIDGVQLVDRAKQREIELSREDFSTSWYYYELDQNSLYKHLAYLKMRDFSGDVSDLEYPYILVKLGSYMEAYKEYNRLLSLAWERQKYIIYFICLYNLKVIRGHIYYFLFLQNRDLAEQFNKKMEEIDLDGILSRLSISDSVRKTLRDLITYRFLSDSAMETDDKAEQIYQQRKLGEKGGSAINSNIRSLLSRFKRELLFCNNNYIITDNNRFYKNICENTVKGILNSYATPDKRADGIEQYQSKITKIYPLCVFALIFCIAPKRLRDMFKRYEIENMELSDDAVESINRYWRNLSNSKYCVFTDISILDNYIQNLIFITSTVKNTGIDMSAVYNTVLSYWDVISCLKINDNLLSHLLEHYEPEPEHAVKILNTILDDADEYDQLHDCIDKLAHYLSIHSVTYELCLAKFKDGKYARVLFPLYKVLPPSLKEDFSAYCQENLKDAKDYLTFIANNNIPILSTEKFSSIIDSLVNQHNWYSDYCSLMLYNIRGNSSYSNVHNIIDAYAQKDDCLKFYMNPSEYNGVINAQWILYASEDIAWELSKIPACKKLLREYLLKDRFIDYNERNYIVKML